MYHKKKMKIIAKNSYYFFKTKKVSKDTENYWQKKIYLIQLKCNKEGWCKMSFLKENKGVIIFYIMIAVFTLILIENAQTPTTAQEYYVMVEK